MLGDIYTRGSWALKPNFRYVKRYKYSGNLNLNIARNMTGDRGAPDFSENKDFSIRWSHRQDVITSYSIHYTKLYEPVGTVW